MSSPTQPTRSILKKVAYVNAATELIFDDLWDEEDALRSPTKVRYRKMCDVGETWANGKGSRGRLVKNGWWEVRRAQHEELVARIAERGRWPTPTDEEKLTSANTAKNKGDGTRKSRYTPWVLGPLGVATIDDLDEIVNEEAGASESEGCESVEIKPCDSCVKVRRVQKEGPVDAFEALREAVMEEVGMEEVVMEEVVIKEVVIKEAERGKPDDTLDARKACFDKFVQDLLDHNAQPSEQKGGPSREGKGFGRRVAADYKGPAEESMWRCPGDDEAAIGGF